jgi:paraquat-inducible protein B
MPKRINPSTVGLFVLGGIAMLVALVLVLGSGKWFSHQDRFVCFFSGSLSGLNVGAPVKFRGVQIGAVDGIMVNLPGRRPAGFITAARAENLRLPVIIELDTKQIAALGARHDVTAGDRLQQLIKAGLRGRLATESLLTGLLYVELNFFPGTPVKVVLSPNDPIYREIPTLPTQLEQLQEAAMQGLGKLGEIDFAALVSSLTEAAQSAHDFISSSELKAGIASLGDAAVSLRKTSDSTREALGKFGEDFGSIANSMKKTSDNAALTMQGARTTLVGLQNVVDPDSPLMYQLTQAADRLGEASQAMRDLATDLDRNPTILLRGRASSDKGQ